MTARPSAQALAALGGIADTRYLADEPLAKYTWLRVGGPADLLAIPETEAALAELLRRAEQHGVPVTMLGGGSNMLVLDGGVRGLVIRLGRGFRYVRHDGLDVTAGGAAPLPQVCLYCVEHGLAGFEWAAGIPGTIGGALVMNAGAHEYDMSMWVKSVRFLTYDGATLVRRGDEIVWHYRESELPPRAVPVEATFTLHAGDPAQLRAARLAGLAHRNATQPIGEPSCGSTFRNPSGDHAARLIEAAGLKGHTIGGVHVSTKHANFFITAPGATAADVRALIALTQKTVKEKFGVDLITEVKVLGEEGSAS